MCDHSECCICVTHTCQDDFQKNTVHEKLLSRLKTGLNLREISLTLRDGPVRPDRLASLTMEGVDADGTQVAQTLLAVAGQAQELEIAAENEEGPTAVSANFPQAAPGVDDPKQLAANSIEPNCAGSTVSLSLCGSETAKSFMTQRFSP